MNIVFSAYFDKFGFNSGKQDPNNPTDNHTNIGLLYTFLSYAQGDDVTAVVDSQRTTKNYTYYASGLGTPFKAAEPVKAGATLALAAGEKTVEDAAKNAPKSTAKATAKEMLKGKNISTAVSDLLKRNTGMSANGWKKNWDRYFHHRELARGGAGISAKQAAKATELMRKHGKDAVAGARKFGLSLAKGVAKEAIKAAALSAVEGTEAADIKWAAQLFKSGHKKRVQEAWDSLARAINNNLNEIKPASNAWCGEARVYIYGAEWGGTMARLFANKIVSECKEKDKKLTFNGVPVRICFVGLFDCVNSISEKSGFGTLLSFTPLPITTSISGTGLTAHVEAALHLFSCHERQTTIASIAGGKAQWQEEWPLPGINSDVCGGRILDKEYGLANLDISKYALCQMHAIARSYGAPLPHPDDGSMLAKALDIILTPDLTLNSENIYEHLPIFQSLTDCATASPTDAVLKSGTVYVKWLRALHDAIANDPDLNSAFFHPDPSRKAMLNGLKTQIDSVEREARRGQQLASVAMEHKLGKIWDSQEYLEDPVVSDFLAAYVHFNSPSMPLNFREVDKG